MWLCLQRQRIAISHDAEVGSVVTRVTATDADSGLNARLVFTVDDRYAFHMDPLTGIITLAVPGHGLGRARYVLDVAVSDSGQPPLTSSVELTVDVTSPLMTSRAGGARMSLTVVVVTVAIVASLVVTIVLVVGVVVVYRKGRRTTDVERQPTASTRAALVLADDFDDNALPALFTHLSRSGATTVRSRDIPVSAATLNTARDNGSSTWLSSLDCSVISAPAACQASTLIYSFH